MKRCTGAKRAWGILLVLGSIALMGTGCSESRSATPSDTLTRSGAASTATHSSPVRRSASTRTTSAPLSMGSFFVEPCANIVGSPLPTSNLDLRPFLLSAAELPKAALIDGPHRTSNTPPKIYASVPTTSPAAYETITLYSAKTPGGMAALNLSEVIGDVGSASFASQWLAKLNADLSGPGCNPGGSNSIPLPGTNPPVNATTSGGTQRSGRELGAKLFAMKGSRLLCLTWESFVSINASGSGDLPNLPPLPDGPEMARVLTNALALIPR